MSVGILSGDASSLRPGRSDISHVETSVYVAAISTGNTTGGNILGRHTVVETAYSYRSQIDTTAHDGMIVAYNTSGLFTVGSDTSAEKAVCNLDIKRSGCSLGLTCDAAGHPIVAYYIGFNPAVSYFSIIRQITGNATHIVISCD